ncbi:MAG: JAB domain-containing protein [Caldilineaceae bacterium SB0664_bin_27]|uniref:JAB domain-containing protein n=1 Tax=Caldilineaceae bacterium SB0664_bin_27 TaxID=2605260 RepID=A0A6B0YX77_9CHLR|nr:JAB domain-containing protein [Caldilineaceae bacterium SB0664_bin_27]
MGEIPPAIESIPSDYPTNTDPSPNTRTAYTIKEMPEDLRPRERLEYVGAGALSAAELLAIVLRTGGPGENVIRQAERLLTDFNGLPGLAHASFEELTKTRGIGKAKVTQIKAALELGRRLLLAAPLERDKIQSPSDVANLLMLEMGMLEREQVRVVLLDTKNNVQRTPVVYSGSLNAAVIRVGEIFTDAVRANSASLIVVHNHPSGDPTPSPEDVQVTKQIVAAGKLLQIDVLDHLIITRNSYVSLKERRLGFD